MSINKKEKLRKLILSHIKMRKDMTERDIYKMLYQANIGNAHILKDVNELKKRLIEELDTVNPNQKEPLLENISTNDKIYRVNLRHFKKKKLSVESLFQVVTESAEVIIPNIQNLIKEWQFFKELIEEKFFKFDINSLRIFDEEIQIRNYPVITHSDKYKKMYNPSYRVVHIEIFEKVFGKTKGINYAS